MEIFVFWDAERMRCKKLSGMNTISQKVKRKT